MGITHSWDGTVLTITSDSGTSSADLKGEKGDTGIRGAQGVKGKTGCVNPEILNDYATQEYVKVKVAEAQVAGSPVDMSAYYTKSETEEKLNALSSALTETASGKDAIAITNPSPIEHNVKLKVSRINLLASPFGELDFLEQGKNYTFSVKLKDEIELPSDYYYILQGEAADGNTVDVLYLWTFDGNKYNEATYSFTVGEEFSIFRILYDDRLTADMFEYCQLEEGIVATEPTDYIEDLNDITFYKYGKNLCDMTKIVARTGDKIEYIDKNTVKWSGSYLFNIPVSIPAGTTFTWSYGDIEVEEGECKGLHSWFMIYEDGASTQNWKVYTATAEKNITAIRVYKNPTDKAIITIHDIQIEIGEKATEYEPYKEPEEIIDINNIPVSDGMSIISDTYGVNIETTYNKDLNKVIADLTSAVISLGGNI